MAFNLESISRGKAVRAPRIVLLGVEKIGKSTWAAGAPNPIFIPVIREEGLDRIDAAKFPVAKTFGDVMACLESLADGQHEFKTVIIDSASALEPLVWDFTCTQNGNAASIEKVNGGFGKGYVEALQHWRDLQTAMDYLRDEKGMGSILIGHTKVKTFNDPLTDPYDQYQFDLQDRAVKLFERWADCILFANRKSYAKAVAVGKQDKAKGAQTTTTHAAGDAERVMFTDKRPAHPGGNRYSLPYELPFTYSAFADALAKSQAA